MKKTAGKIFTAALILGTTSTMAYGAFNPLKSYDLYADTHNSASPSERENVMSEYYSNSLAAQKNKKNNSSQNYGSSSSSSSGSSVGSLPKLPDIPKYDGSSSNTSTSENNMRRNDYLRESSKKVFADSSTPAAWKEAHSFYNNPSLESIKTKYKKSNFAGCMQECESYVQKHPNDTLGYYYLAMCYTKVNDKENAIKAYEKVIALNSNPMIVKYATNGRNCVMQGSEKCYQNVNEPELIYPYANVAEIQNLTPVDPNTLIQRNLNNLYGKLAPATPASSNENGENKEGGKLSLPFGNQDADLDKFINAPYGNGLSPKLNNEYKEQQLNKIQETINDNSNNSNRNMENIRKFDRQKSDAGSTTKIAYAESSPLQDADYIAAQKEINELNILLGNNNSQTSSSDDLVKYVSEHGENLSPEVIQSLMVKSMMPDFTFVNSDSKNLL